jgi:hypothetical protein
LGSSLDIRFLLAAARLRRSKLNGLAKSRETAYGASPSSLSHKAVGLGLLGDWLVRSTGSERAMSVAWVDPSAPTLGGSLRSEIYNRAMGFIGRDKHSPSDVWPELARFGLGHIPFANLFYLKRSFDYLVAYHLFEAMKPGWYRRTNEMMKKQQGRTMIGYRPGAQIPYTPPQIGAIFQ